MCLMCIQTACMRRTGRGGGGGAGYGVWFGALHPLNISTPLPGPVQTNNRAELTACLEALGAVPLSQPLCIITDSKYVYDGVTAYMHHWALQGRRVTDQDLWGPSTRCCRPVQRKRCGSMCTAMWVSSVISEQIL